MESTPLKLNILIVDDDLDVLCSLQFLLETEGFNVVAFQSSEQVLRATMLPVFDCLVIDYQMPALNGVDLVLKLRERWVSAPAVLITGSWDSSVVFEALAAGIDRIVHKPNLDSSLVNCIRSVVASA